MEKQFQERCSFALQGETEKKVTIKRPSLRKSTGQLYFVGVYLSQYVKGTVFFMLHIILALLVFWYWPVRDIRRVIQVRDIGDGTDHKISRDVVESWKKGRLAAKKQWLMFGTLVITSTIFNWMIVAFWGENGAAPSADMAWIMSIVELLCLAVGLIGVACSLLNSGTNNKRYLGQWWVRF